MQDPTDRLDQPPATNVDWIAIVFAMLFPTLVTLVYFEWLKDSEASF